MTYLNTKLKCLLLDDELPGLSYLKILCQQIPELEVIKAFNDTESFLNEFSEIDFDLLILDIEMPGLSGIEIAKILSNKLIIFTTAYKEFAVEAFDLDAVDYLIKPLKLDRLSIAIKKALKITNKSDVSGNYIQLATNKGNSIVYPEQVVYLSVSENDPRDKDILLENGQTLCLKNISFEKLLALLPENKFCRINKKEIIALKTVVHYSNHQIFTNINTRHQQSLVLKLGDSFRQNFFNSLSK